MTEPSDVSARTGLVSISFRSLTPTQIVGLTVSCGLQSIELGGDIHVPHGDLRAAREARQLCNDAGIYISAYGSYYRAGATVDQTPPFEAVLASAVALGAPSIRIWAGNVGSADADDAVRQRITDDLSRIASLAAAQNIRVALEYHGNTLTDTPDSALALLQSVNQPNLHTYWQPRHGLPIDEGLHDIQRLGPYLDNIHVFHWWPDSNTRLPLADGVDRWAAYIHKIRSIPGDHILSLEFVRGDDPAQLRTDAQTLQSLLADSRPT